MDSMEVKKNRMAEIIPFAICQSDTCLVPFITTDIKSLIYWIIVSLDLYAK